MAYCGETDLLLSEATVTSLGEKARFIKSAAGEIDGKLGYIYATPIDTAGLPPHQAQLLLSINAKLASGRLMMAAAFGSQDTNVNAYALYLVKEAEMDLMSIANGQVDLTAPKVDPAGDPIGTIEDPAIVDPYARIPSGWNPDQVSAVTIFEQRFLGGGSDDLWIPGENILYSGRVEQER